ncbi:MAG: hypothetical protein QXT74_00110 [Candidatus Nezhaarchaeales archaeon]
MSKRLAVCASNIADCLAISEALREANIPFNLLEPDDPCLNAVDVIVTTREEAEKFKGLEGVKVVEAEACRASTIAKVTLALQGRAKFKELLIGVDPGRSYGLAFIADSIILGLSVHREAERVVREIKEVVKTGLFEKVVIKVGDGSPEHRDRVLSLVKEQLRGVEVKLVSEEGSSLPAPFIKRAPRDAVSAFYLALRN